MYSSRNTNPRQTWDSSFAGSRDKSQSQRWSSEWLQHSRNCHALPKAPSCIGALTCVAYALAFKEALQIDRIVWYTCISTKQRNFLHHRVLGLKPTSERRARSIALRTQHMGEISREHRLPNPGLLWPDQVRSAARRLQLHAAAMGVPSQTPPPSRNHAG
jgi:hypothetical protein